MIQAIPDYRIRRSFLIALLVFLIHLLFLFIGLWTDKWFSHDITRPKSIPYTPMTAKELDAIKNQWTDLDKEKRSVLLKQKAETAEIPDHAKFISDKTRKVIKETKAKEAAVIPVPAAAPKPVLKQLGIDFKLQQLSKRADPNGNGPPPEGTSQVGTRNHSDEIQKSNRGSDQNIVDRKLVEGSENMLNSVESIFHSFYSRLYQAIAPLWSNQIRNIPTDFRVTPGEYLTAVDVVLNQGGTLVEVRHLKDCGVPLFDQAVDHALNKIHRFPNPPAKLVSQEDGRVHTTWTFSVQVGNTGSSFNFLPPERVE